jgi:hypothetical protein
MQQQGVDRRLEPAAEDDAAAAAAAAASAAPTAVAAAMRVAKMARPPSRREGGGFTIRDILSGFSTQELDPFLIWHELPRARHGRGEMPGAPMHAHRGFMECPYAKEIGGDTPYNYMNGAVEAGGKRISAQAAQGNFELVPAVATAGRPAGWLAVIPSHRMEDYCALLKVDLAQNLEVYCV